jgi:outer membrane immunogenic protein
MHRLVVASLTAASLSVGLTAAASAADLGRPAPAPVYTKAPLIAPWSWTGFYVGGNVGGSWGTDKISTTSSPPNFVAGFASALDAVTGTSLHPNGVIGGVQAGYNWQFSNVVLGIEADADWAGQKGSRSVTFGPLAGVGAGTFMSDSSKETFLATIRPRIGWAFDHALLYGTGGVAFGTVKTSDTLGFPGNFLDVTNATTTRTGWTAGAGLEWAFNRNWSAKVEYLHVDLGSFDVGLVCSVACVTTNDTVVHHKVTDEIARVGVNYQFH